jgi:hypothetical protein
MIYYILIDMEDTENPVLTTSEEDVEKFCKDHGEFAQVTEFKREENGTFREIWS